MTAAGHGQLNPKCHALKFLTYRRRGRISQPRRIRTILSRRRGAEPRVGLARSTIFPIREQALVNLRLGDILGLDATHRVFFAMALIAL